MQQQTGEWEKRLPEQTAVKGGRCFNAGTSVACNNRLANSVQTHFFDTGSAAAVGRQERWTQRFFVWLAKRGEESEELRQPRLRVRSARGGQEKALHRELCGAAHWEGDLRAGRKCENALELRGRAPADFQDRRCTGLFEQQVPVKSVFAQTR